MITSTDSASTSLDADDATTPDDLPLAEFSHIMDPALEQAIAKVGDATRALAWFYTELGYPVTRIGYGEKIPCHSDWSSPYEHREGETESVRRGHTYDPDIALSWFHPGQGKDYEIGLVTNGLVVVDFDVKEHPWTEAEMAEAIGIPLEELQQVPAARTPSGGWHFVFADETDEGKYAGGAGHIHDTDGKPIVGMDIRARGGQIKVYPGLAQRPKDEEPGPEWTGRYTWVEGRELPHREELPTVPPSLASRLKTWTPKSERSTGVRPSLTAFDNTRLVGILEGQELITEGSRNDTLYRVGCLLRGCMGAGDDQVRETLHKMNETRFEEPLPDDEVETTIASVCTKPPEVKPYSGPGGLAPYEALAYGFIADCEQRNVFYRWHAGESRFYRYADGRYTAENAEGHFQADLLRWIGTYKNEQGEKLKGKPTSHRGEMLPFVKQLLTIPKDAFVDNGKKPLRLCENGWLDLSPIDEGKDPILLPHTPDWFTRWAPMPAYDANATAPDWEDTTRKILHDAERTPEENEELYRFFMRALGSSLHPKYHTDTAGVLYGGGNNGKSTILAGVKAANGISNSAAYSFQELSKPFARSELPKYNSIITNELPKTGTTDEGSIKALLTGEELRAEIKSGPHFSIYLRLFMLFATNHLPTFSDKGESIVRRFWYIPCPNTMPFDATKRDWKDPQVWVEKGEAPGILNLLIAGAKDLRKTGYTVLDLPGFLREETKEAVESSSLELDFIKHEGPLFTGVHEDFVTEAKVHGLYQQYAARQGRGNSIMSRANFCRMLRRHHDLPENKREMVGARGEPQTPVIRRLRWADSVEG